MRPTKIYSVLLGLMLVALAGCQSRPKPAFLDYTQLDDVQRQAIENYYAPEAVKAREEEKQGRQRQWGNQFTLQAKREAEVPPPQFQYNTLEGEADRNRAERKSNDGCNCRVKPFKALKRGFGL
ncbi:hypothetical protein [Elstera sp.]|jgi:hypothetical protein|uniref:hypothetical protein n=1 Tax=Elstera sp. TaxID=1916664 RepID=UPI0037C081CE